MVLASKGCVRSTRRAASSSSAAAGTARSTIVSASAIMPTLLSGTRLGCRSAASGSNIPRIPMGQVPVEGPEELFHFAPAEAAGAARRTRRAAQPGEKLLITGIAGGQGRLIAQRLASFFRISGVDRSRWDGAPAGMSMHVVDLRKRKFEDVF